jgi:hypothetical protein
MNHKRRRAKKRRAGCLRCKPHKGNGHVPTFHVKGIKGKVDRNEVKEMAEETEDREATRKPRWEY